MMLAGNGDDDPSDDGDGDDPLDAGEALFLAVKTHSPSSAIIVNRGF